jgi:signal transduction histidine kinase
LPRVKGDRDRLQQVFFNLLDNAIKYGRGGGETVVHLAQDADLVQVEVRDDGIGIAPDDLPHIFDPLYRSEQARDQPGTGLGLTMVRTILEQHGATIDVHSVLGRGTTFRFELPCA